MKLADRVERVPPSGIRKFFDLAAEADDVISLGVGEPDFSTPWSAREAAISSLEQGRTSYTPNRGLSELRDAISQRAREHYGLEYDPGTEVLVTAGASEAIDLSFRALVDPGDMVAISQPSYVSYPPGVIFAGGEVLSVPTQSEEEFVLTRDALEESGAADASVLVLCYPNNPTGATMSREELKPVAEFCREHDLAVIADEIYADLTYEGEHASIATLPGMAERTIVINGFSKSHAMTGLRLGYALAPPEASAAMTRIHQYTMLSAPTTAQYAAIDALRNCEGDVREMCSQYDRRRRFVLSRFSEMGINCFDATGAFYVFPEAPGGDSDAFAEALLEEAGVAVVPGDVFGEGGEGHLRVSYATGLADLREAMNRIESFVVK